MQSLSTCLSIVFAFFFLTHSLSAQEWAWLNTAGQETGSNDGAPKNLVKRVGQDDQGHFYASGHFRDFITLGETELDATEKSCSGCYEIFLSKLDADGQYIWSTQMKGPNDLLYDMHVENDGDVFLVGTYSRGSVALGDGKQLPEPDNEDFDGFVVKYNSEGSCEWARTYGAGGTDFCYSLAPDRQGGFYLTGYFSDTMQFGASTLISSGSKDFFLGRIDSTGQPLFAVRGGGERRDEGNQVATDPKGNAYVIGKIEGEATFDGITLRHSGNHDGFLLKYNPSGDLLWAQQMAGNENDFPLDLDVDTMGHAFVSGQYQDETDIAGTTLENEGAYDGFISMFNPSGKLVWVKNMGAQFIDRFNALKADGQGGCYVSGTFAGDISFGGYNMSAPFQFDLCFFQIDRFGTVEWGQQTGGPGTEYCRSILIDKEDHLLAGGYFIGKTQFGAFTADAMGDNFGTEDLFLAKTGEALAVDDKQEIPGIKIFPNPTSNFLYVEFPELISDGSLELSDAQGRTLMRRDYAHISELKLPVNSLVPGIYFIQLSYDDQSLVREFIVQK